MKAERDRFILEDPWAVIISAWLIEFFIGHVTVTEVLTACLKIAPKHITRMQMRRAMLVLMGLGWTERTREMKNGVVQTFFRKPKSEDKP